MSMSGTMSSTMAVWKSRDCGRRDAWLCRVRITEFCWCVWYEFLSGCGLRSRQEQKV